MNLLNFIKQFPDEETCRKKFKEIRDKEGVKCKKCGNLDHYWLSTKEQYQCKKCGFRTTLRSGTVLQASKLPFRYWFIAIHLLTSTKKSFSALELQKQLGHKFYEPVWAMLQKLRAIMGKRDSLYLLDKIVEMDEGYFSSVDTELTKKKNQKEKKKRGRGSQKKSKVLVMASTKYDLQTTQKHNKSKQFRFVKMQVISDLKGETIDNKVKEHISYKSVVKTDNYSSYSEVKKNVWRHQPETVKPEEAIKILPWVHTMISNAKRTLLGIHHMISKKYMQNYLDEFCYKVNRRYFGEKIFDRLMVACVSNDLKFSGT
jgi:DNA-directed RNA polymerase subunit RPC12/RpoP